VEQSVFFLQSIVLSVALVIHGPRRPKTSSVLAISASKKRAQASVKPADRQPSLGRTCLIFDRGSRAGTGRSAREPRSEQLVPDQSVPRPMATEASELLERTGLDQRRTLIGLQRCTPFPGSLVLLLLCPLPVCPLPGQQDPKLGRAAGRNAARQREFAPCY